MVFDMELAPFLESYTAILGSDTSAILEGDLKETSTLAWLSIDFLIFVVSARPWLLLVKDPLPSMLGMKSAYLSHDVAQNWILIYFLSTRIFMSMK